MKKLEVNKELLQKTLKRGTTFALAGAIVLGGHTAILKDNSLGIQTVSAVEQNIVNLDVQMGVNLYMNDRGFVPTDVNGNETYPFIYEGTTYVPVRAIAQLFNATINWDEKTKTVVIATTGESAKLTHTYRPKQELYNKTITAETGVRLVVNGQECIPKDVNGNIKDIYIVNGTTYVPVRAVSETLDLPITWSDKTNSVFIGLHKTTGLTVENMGKLTDPAVYYQSFENFYTGSDWAYYFFHSDGSIGVGTCEGYGSIIAYLLNEEYLDVDIYKNYCEYRFRDHISYNPNIAENIFNNYQYELFQFASRLPYATEENPFDWDNVIINPEYADFLNRYQNAGYQSYINHDYTIVRDFIAEYFYGTDGNLHYGKCNPVIDALVTAAPLYSNKTTIYSIFSKEYSDFYDAYFDAENKVVQKIQEMYECMFSKKLTK